MPNIPTLIAPVGSWTTIPALLLKLRQQEIVIENAILIATENNKAKCDFGKISTFVKENFPTLEMTLLITAGVDDIRNMENASMMRRVILYASALNAWNKSNFYCLSGGRKTMSSDLQFAASYFGAEKLYHLILPPELDNGSHLYKEFEAAIERNSKTELEEYIKKFVLVEIPQIEQHAGFTLRQEEFKQALVQTQKQIHTEYSNDYISIRTVTGSADLILNLVSETIESSEHLTLNYHNGKPPPWNSLLLLPPNILLNLQKTTLDENPDVLVELLRRIPKAELHCHIGGVLSLDAQIRVGRYMWSKFEEHEKNTAREWLKQNENLLSSLLKKTDAIAQPATLKQILETSNNLRPIVTAAILAEETADQLNALLWNPSVRRFGLGATNRFYLYEEPGEFSGSAVLKDKRAIPEYAAGIVEFCVRHNLRILELRCSPAKYISNERNGFGNQLDFIKCMSAEINIHLEKIPSLEPRPRIALILICDRRKPESFRGTIETLLQIQKDESLRRLVVGIDIAGDEISSMSSDDIAAELTKVREHSLHTTVHAGETATGGAVWTAVHRFSADRVGHALTLLDDPNNGENLVRKLRDRRITLELCPSSNREVVGYGFRGENIQLNKKYPLREYLNHNLKVSLCTDNPGISKTTPENEFFVASKMCETPLSLTECLELIKNSFTSSFLPADELDSILNSVDSEIFRLLKSRGETLSD